LKDVDEKQLNLMKEGMSKNKMEEELEILEKMETNAKSRQKILKKGSKLG
jgi:hypothetical protein